MTIIVLVLLVAIMVVVFFVCCRVGNGLFEIHRIQNELEQEYWRRRFEYFKGKLPE